MGKHGDSLTHDAATSRTEIEENGVFSQYEINGLLSLARRQGIMYCILRD